MVGGTIAVALLDPDFIKGLIGLITDSFGNGFLTSLIVLVLPQIAMALRNQYVLKKSKLGASRDEEEEREKVILL